jgi:ectoine hydroxylase-related dioxygenase (phytanoyl-CoA dioxygenase family)
MQRHTHLPFHRDQTVIGSRLLNIWIPLVACGRDAPGLELVAGSDGTPLDPANPLAAGLVERARLDEASVLEAFPAEALWRPVLAPGDVLVFSGETIHRTYIAPGMKRPRASIDLRLV